MGGEGKRYDAADITVLEGAEAIRKRPGMYVGSTGEHGLHQAVYEVVGRAVNEVLADRASTVDVGLTPDGGVSVTDDGAAEVAGGADGPGLEAMLTRMATRWSPAGRNTVAMSRAGLGVCVTNALSSRLTAEVRRGGTRWLQQYTRGVADAAAAAVGPAVGSGTTIAFRPDPGIFENVECSFAVLAERFRELAFLNQGLGISLTDARQPGEPRSVRFNSPGGARDFVAFLDAPGGVPARVPVHPDIVGFAWEDERMEGSGEVALRWGTSGEERVRGFANSAPTPYGGTHVTGFREGAAAAVNAYARRHRLPAAAGPELSANQIGAGLTAVVSVKLDFPEFHGATGGGLGNAAVRDGVAEAVRNHLGSWLEAHPEQASAVIDRTIAAARTPDAGPGGGNSSGFGSPPG